MYGCTTISLKPIAGNLNSGNGAVSQGDGPVEFGGLGTGYFSISARMALFEMAPSERAVTLPSLMTTRVGITEMP